MELDRIESIKAEDYVRDKKVYPLQFKTFGNPKVANGHITSNENPTPRWNLAYSLMKMETKAGSEQIKSINIERFRYLRQS